MKRLLLILTMLIAQHHTVSALSQPNIVVMLADDMGFGEVQSYNPKRGKIPTPQLDALAQKWLDCQRRAQQLFGLHADTLRLDDGAVCVANPPTKRCADGWAIPHRGQSINTRQDAQIKRL